MVDGAIYAIPFTHNTFFMFYDKTITIGPDDVTSDQGETNANGSHNGFETDGTEIDYDTYN